MVKQYNIRPTRLLHDLKKKKPYVIFNGKKIYLKTTNKKLIKYILNKYFLKTKKKLPKKEAEKRIKQYIQSGLKSEIYGISGKDLTTKTPEKPILVKIEDINKRLTPQQFRQALPQLQNENIRALPEPEIDVRRDGRIKFDFRRHGLGYITFDSIQSAEQNAPLLIDKYQNQINEKIHNLQMEGHKKLLEERKEKKIQRRQFLQQDLRNQINLNENNINLLMSNNVEKFRDSFKKKLFEVKQNAGKKILKQKILEWETMPFEEKYNYYNERMKILKRHKNDNFKWNEYKEGITKKDLLQLANLNQLYEDNKMLEAQAIHHAEKEEIFKKMKLSEIDDDIIDTLTEPKEQKSIFVGQKKLKRPESMNNIFSLSKIDYDNLITPQQDFKSEKSSDIVFGADKQKFKKLESDIYQGIQGLKKFDIRGEEAKIEGEEEEEDKASEQQKRKNYYKSMSGSDIFNLSKSQNLEIESMQSQGYKQFGGLWNYQIDRIMKPFKYYIKAIPLNFLNEILNIIKKQDLKKFSFVLNTETTQSKYKGHWIAIYCDLENDYSCEIYDPLAEKRTYLYKNLEKKFTELFNDMQIPYYVKFKKNTIKQQSSNSNNCGWFCIRFLLMRMQNIPYKRATGYKGIEENENNINSLRKSYNKFGYV